MEASKQSIVESAIDECTGIIASITPGQQTLSFSGQFLKRDVEGFTFQTDFLPAEFTPYAIQSGLRTTFHFGISGAAVQFQADVLAIETNANPAVVHCALPSDITVSQRRAHFRAPATSDSPLELLLWNIPSHWILRDRPKPSMQLRVELCDLSVGGMCLKILAYRRGPETLAIGERLRAEFTHNKESAIMDAEIIYRTPPDKNDGSVRIGVAFRKLANSIDGRRAGSLLNRLIGALQRHRIRQRAAIPA